MRFNTLADWLEWQSGLHPNPIDLGLERVATVYQQLGLPPRLAPVTFVVAGTNGKGSTVAYLEQMALAAGYTTLTFTSPHLYHYTERLRWCGRDITNESLWCESFEQIDQARGDLSLTYFEFGTLAAFLMAQRLTPDVCILEVGLGGRLDAVNLISGDAAIITNIELDHCDWLGDTREEIGAEKAGIARSGRPLIFASPSLPKSVERVAKEQGAHLICANRDYLVKRDDPFWELEVGATELFSPAHWRLPLPQMPGTHQVNNAAAAVMAFHSVSDRLTVPDAVIATAMTAMLPGRCEVLPGPILRILDVSHNSAAIGQLAEVISACSIGGRTVAIFGMMQRKDLLAGIAPLAGLVDHWIVPEFGNDEMFSAADVVTVLKGQVAKPVEQVDGMAGALAYAQRILTAGDILVVFGSFKMVEFYRQAVG